MRGPLAHAIRGAELLGQVLDALPRCYSCECSGVRRVATRAPGLQCDYHAWPPDAAERYEEQLAGLIREAERWRSWA